MKETIGIIAWNTKFTEEALKTIIEIDNSRVIRSNMCNLTCEMEDGTKYIGLVHERYVGLKIDQIIIFDDERMNIMDNCNRMKLLDYCCNNYLTYKLEIPDEFRIMELIHP